MTKTKASAKSLVQASTEEVLEDMIRDPQTKKIEDDMTARIESLKVEPKETKTKTKVATAKVAPISQGDVITVKQLVAMFEGIDGKYIRRHLRKHFIIGGIRKVQEDTHSTYSWTKDDPQLAEIIAYFTKLNPTTK